MPFSGAGYSAESAYYHPSLSVSHFSRRSGLIVCGGSSGTGTGSGFESSDEAAEIRVSKLAAAFQRLLDDVSTYALARSAPAPVTDSDRYSCLCLCREEKRFTAICLIDLKLLEANLAVNEERYHPVALRERYECSLSHSLSLCVSVLV
jgi:hypothetical protein